MNTNIANLELILDTITDGIVVVNDKGIVLYANRSAELIFGRGNLLGKALGVPLSSENAVQDINLIRASGIGWAELRATPTTWENRAAYVIGVHDITERVQAESDRRIAATAFDSQVGMMITDAQVRILKVNQAFTTITGYELQDVAGKSPGILSSGMHGANFYIDMWDSLARTGTWNGEIWNRRKNGEIYPEHLTITAVKDKQDCITNYVGALTDSTQRQQTLEQLRRTASQLTIANEQIEEERARLAERVVERTAELLLANQAKDSFLATMSHEIRTPLAGLMGMMELLDLSRLDDKQRELLRAARSSSSGLLRIVNDILDWSKIEAGKLELSPQTNRIRDTLQGALDIYSQLAVDKDIQITLEIDSRLADSHHFDSLRVSQIINNYLSNAIKFTARGRVQVRAEWLEHLNGCDTVRFSVKDSGVGISPDQQSRLFQQYEQASADTARMHGGTGLGLSICRKLAEMMGGFLSVNSVPEKGSTFSFTVDLPVSEHPSADVTSHESGDTSDIGPLVGAGQVVTVLVADDHPINRMLLKQQLDVLGLRADAAPDGEVAFTLWQNGRYDLVITDCHMPRMDGYELARNIRKMELQSGKKRIPIIGWTANVLSEEFENCIAAGMDDVMTKPTELSDMRATLAKWLEQSGVPD